MAKANEETNENVMDGDRVACITKPTTGAIAAEPMFCHTVMTPKVVPVLDFEQAFVVRVMTMAGNAPAAVLKTKIEIMSGKPAAVPATVSPNPITKELTISSTPVFLNLSQAYPNTGVAIMPNITKLLESMLAETGVKPLKVLNEDGPHVRNAQATML